MLWPCFKLLYLIIIRYYLNLTSLFNMVWRGSCPDTLNMDPMVFPVHFFSSEGIISFLFAVEVRWYVLAKDFRSGADKRFRAFSRSSLTRSFSVQNRVTFKNCNVTHHFCFNMLQVLIAMYLKCKENKNIEIKCLLFLKSWNREKSTFFRN